jgi:mevalonate kinase
MITEISVGSKTFLVGEYAALLKSPCILLNTTPRFSLELRHKHNEFIAHHDNFNSITPAGKFLHIHYKDFEHDDIQFFDPHYGRGGFGASSAQFALLYLAQKYKNKSLLSSTKDKNNLEEISGIIEAYQQYAWNGLGSKPSGADVISQLHGHICYIDFAKGKTETFDWPFEQLDFFLVHTNNKLATHEHLKFVKSIDCEPLNSITAHAYQAFKLNDPYLLIDSINAYSMALEKQGYVVANTQKILTELKKQDIILAAKGCGALGADVLLIVYAIEKQSQVKNWLNLRGFNIMASKKDITSGYNIIEDHV